MKSMKSVVFHPPLLLRQAFSPNRRKLCVWGITDITDFSVFGAASAIGGGKEIS